MYENLVETLRFCAKNGDCHDCPYEKPCAGTMGDGLYCEAADAIEKLSRRETPMKITEIHVDEYYCPACGAENNCDEGDVQDVYCPVCGQRLLPEPPKEEA